ncbi:hypothetical protein, partial [Saliphagus infecundisoli]
TYYLSVCTNPVSALNNTRLGRVLMEWSLWDKRDDQQTGRRISAVPHDGPEGAWKAVLEMQPHAEFWVERATIGYGDSPADFDVVNP